MHPPKVVVLGECAVGKTSIIRQFSTGQFGFDTLPTTSTGTVEMAVILRSRPDPIKIMIWDTCGQERFRALVPMYLAHSAAALIVVDVTNSRSLRDVEEWKDLVLARAPENCTIYVVANKMDLDVSLGMEELRSFCAINNFELLYCSAKNHEQVVQVFQRVAQDLEPPTPAAAPTVMLGDGQEIEGEKKGSGQCCH
jgi:Ras-related protein Rab-6A